MITQDELQKRYDAATPEVRAMVDSDEVFDAFHKIREKYSLHIDHAGNLAQIINALILEAVPFTELDALLKEAMPGVDDATRLNVVKDVNEMIFVPLRNKAREVAEARARALIPGKTSPVAAPRIQRVEEKLKGITDMEPAPSVLPKPESLPQIAPAATITPPPATGPSVIVQKLGAPTAPAAPPTPLTPQPSTPPRYHGSDPYREMPE